MTIDFFARALADVADPQVAGQAIEAVAERIPHAVGPDFVVAGYDRRHVATHRRYGLDRRDRVVAVRVAGKVVAVDVDPQNLAQKVVGDVLRVAGAGACVPGAVVVAAAAVAGGNVQIAVRSD